MLRTELPTHFLNISTMFVLIRCAEKYKIKLYVYLLILHFVEWTLSKLPAHAKGCSTMV